MIHRLALLLIVRIICIEGNLTLVIFHYQSDKKNNSIRGEFILHQNFPNLFTSVTNIKFKLEKSGIVLIIVYNIIGEAIEELISGYKETGTYNV